MNTAPFFYLDFKAKQLKCEQIVCQLNSLALVIVPHQDDESISMGGTISKLKSFNFNVQVVYITTEYDTSGKIPIAIHQRKNEAFKALWALGIRSRKAVHFIDLPDGDLKHHVLDYEKTAGKLKLLITEIEIQNKQKQHISHTLVLTTSRLDAHRDHEETFHLIKNACRGKIVMEFPTANHISSDFSANCIIDISSWSARKHRALSAYRGQIKLGRILWNEIGALDRYFGKLIEVEKAEVCHISWYGYVPTLPCPYLN